MRRREFITLLGGAAVWPIAAHAQQGERMRRASVLMAYVESDTRAQEWTKAFDNSLQELGWNNGRNIQLDYRWAGPNPDRLRGGAEELVRLSPDVLLAGATPAVMALQHATRSIPIVFANVADPVGQGLIASFARPGGNTTGFGGFDFSIAGKWVQTIKEIAPAVARIGVIFNPETGPYNESMLPFVETASGPLSVKSIPTAIHDSERIAQIVGNDKSSEGRFCDLRSDEDRHGYFGGHRVGHHRRDFIDHSGDSVRHPGCYSCSGQPRHIPKSRDDRASSDALGSNHSSFDSVRARNHCRTRGDVL